MVITRQKFMVTLISPRMFGPKKRAMKKLKTEGVNPMKINEIAV